MRYLRIQFTDRFPRHPRAPDRITWNIGIFGIAIDFAVYLEVRAESTFFTPQREPPRNAILGFEVLLPKLPRFDDMGISIKDSEALARHRLSSFGTSGMRALPDDPPPTSP